MEMLMFVSNSVCLLKRFVLGREKVEWENCSLPVVLLFWRSILRFHRGLEGICVSRGQRVTVLCGFLVH